MIAIILADSQKKERERIKKEIQDLTARKTDERLSVIQPGSLSEVRKLKKMHELVHMSVMDVVMADGIEAAESVRKQYPQSEMMIVADMTVSPLRYITPQIRAASLLLRPFSDEQLRSTCEQFFVSTLRQFDTGREDQLFLIKNSDGRTLIPYDSIYYFEAVNKKIAVRTGKEEYEIHNTIEKLLEVLPDHFMRCHRSFIINKRMIRKVRLSDGIIELSHSITIPLSRSYKKAIKEYMDGRKKP